MNASRFFTILILLIPAITLQAQNFWYDQAENKNMTMPADTDCPVYNAGDPEVNIEWQYIIDDEGNNDRAMDIDFTPDSNLVFINYGGKYFREIDIDDGSEIWKKSYFIDDTIPFYGQKFIQIKNYYYLSGWWEINDTMHYGILKTNLNGEKLWIKTIGIEKKKHKKNKQKNIEYFNPRIINVEETNFLVSLQLDDEFKIIKYDSTCVEIWELNNEELGYDNSIELKLFFDKVNYLIYSREFLSKIDIDGKEVWTEFPNQEEFTNCNYFNNNYYCSGYDYQGIDRYQWIRRYTRDYILEMEYSINSNDQSIISFASSIQVLKDESILVFYDFEYYGNEYEDHTNMNILHLDKDGNCISTLNLYEYGSQYTTELLVTKEGDYILFGYGYEDFSQESLTVIAKVKPWDITNVLSPANKPEELNIYPNPFKNTIDIEFNNNFSGIVKLISIDGKLVHKKSIRNQYEYKINTETIDKGIYIISAENEKSKYIQKLIKD